MYSFFSIVSFILVMMMSCKPVETSSGQSLDNIATGDFQLNRCELNEQDRDLYVADIRSFAQSLDLPNRDEVFHSLLEQKKSDILALVDSSKVELGQPELKDDVKKLLWALNYGHFKRLTLEDRFKLVVGKEEKPQACQKLDYAQNEDQDWHCYFVEWDAEKKIQKLEVHIGAYEGDYQKAVRHALIRDMMAAYFDLIALKEEFTEDENNLYRLLATTFRSELESKAKVDARYQAGLDRLDQIEDDHQKIRSILSEAYDSYLCSKETRTIFSQEFKLTHGFFTGSIFQEDT